MENMVVLIFEEEVEVNIYNHQKLYEYLELILHLPIELKLQAVQVDYVLYQMREVQTDIDLDYEEVKYIF